MTVLEYIVENNIQEFYCKTTTELILAHTHKSKKNKETEICQLFGRENLCQRKDWDQYRSFASFADKEIATIGKARGMLIFYVNFTTADWQREIENIFPEDKTDYDYYISLERLRTR